MDVAVNKPYQPNIKKETPIQQEPQKVEEKDEKERSKNTP